MEYLITVRPHPNPPGPPRRGQEGRVPHFIVSFRSRLRTGMSARRHTSHLPIAKLVLLYFCSDRNNRNDIRKTTIMKPILAMAADGGNSMTSWCYLLYLGISLALTVWVARTLHKNGRIFLVDSFLGDEALADSVNHLLVV